MLVFPDLIVEKVLREVIDSICANPAPIGEMLRYRPEKEVADLKTYLVTNGSVDLKVRLGYPRNPQSVPGVYVSLGDSSEIDQTIGSTDPDDLTPELNAVPGQPIPETLPVSTGTRFRSTVRIAVRSPNAGFGPLLCGILTTVLIAYRLSMENEGLRSQTLTFADLTPDANGQPDIVFQRDIRMSCEHEATSVTIVRTLDGVTINVTPTTPFADDPTPPIAVVRNSGFRRRAA